MNIEKIQEELKKDEYKFLSDNPLLGDNVCLLTLGGSIAYGTDIETSDIDIRGITLESPKDIIGFGTFEQFNDNQTDTVIYGFNKIINLLTNCNPNIIEMLGCKPEHYLKVNDIGKSLLSNRDMFLSQKAIFTFGGYALAQLNRFRDSLGVHNDEVENLVRSMNAALYTFEGRYKSFEHGSINIRNLNDFGNKQAVVDITLKDFPVREFSGISNELYNIVKSYDKINSRNSKKDAAHINKHAMHLVRLYMMGSDILTKGEINTYRENDREILMDIRNGKYLNEDNTFNSAFFDLKDEFAKKFDYAAKHTILPVKPDYERIESFKMSVNRKIIENEHSITKGSELIEFER